MLEMAVAGFLADHRVEGARVLVAVSGGRDSIALLHALVASRRVEVAAAHVDHGLRGAESDADAAFVEASAAKLGVPCLVRRVEPASLREGLPNRERPTLQEAARTLRYAALSDMAAQWQADWTATAHHADDQAETVLMAILRGCGPDGLAGIPALCRQRRLMRPLLATGGDAIEAWARARAIDWREDASNRSDAYTRNRVRGWLPKLAKEFNPRLLQTLAHLAEAQRDELDWTEALVQQELADRLDAEGRLSLAGFDALPRALARRLLRGWWVRHELGRSVSRRHLDRALAFLTQAPPPERGRAIELPGGWRVRHLGASARLEPPAGGAPGEVLA